MTTDKLREAIAAIESAISRLDKDKYALVLQLEETEGRPDSHRARFARAALAGDVQAMTRLCAEGEVEHMDRFGHAPQQEIRDEVKRILAERDALEDRRCPECQTGAVKDYAVVCDACASKGCGVVPHGVAVPSKVLHGRSTDGTAAPSPDDDLDDLLRDRPSHATTAPEAM